MRRAYAVRALTSRTVVGRQPGPPQQPVGTADIVVPAALCEIVYEVPNN
ncbi:hypothetical protein ACFCWY_18895 [Streptomyces sp. NPDC056362]